MSTKETLASVLRERGLHDMALRAAQGVYDDFESDSAMPINDLARDLRAAGHDDLAARAINGEFDGTKEESDVWYQREGKHALKFDGTKEESDVWYQREGKHALMSDILDKGGPKKKERARDEIARRALKPDAQAFDEIRITTAPRYKTSGLSGDEWRISARIEFLRKGIVRHTDGARDIESAAKFLAWKLAMAQDEGKAYFAGEGNFCDQEGCAEQATVTLRRKVGHCDRCGTAGEYQPESVRKFCDKHKVRGDCGIDDSDSNYEPMP